MTPCKLKFVCNKDWMQLLPTKNASARYCDDCKKAVFMIRNDREFNLALALKRCVGISDDNDFTRLVGEPLAPLDGTKSVDWITFSQFTPVSVSIELVGSVSKERIAELKIFYPILFNNTHGKRDLLSGNSVSLGRMHPQEYILLQQELINLAPELRLKSDA